MENNNTKTIDLTDDGVPENLQRIEKIIKDDPVALAELLLVKQEMTDKNKVTLDNIESIAKKYNVKLDLENVNESEFCIGLESMSSEDGRAILELYKDFSNVRSKALDDGIGVLKRAISRKENETAELNRQAKQLQDERDRLLRINMALKNRNGNSVKKIYPNDPCPCGSGKKYKKCCGRG